MSLGRADDVTLRPTSPTDLEHVRSALVEAAPGTRTACCLPSSSSSNILSWRVTHRGWGRAGHVGVVAEKGETSSAWRSSDSSPAATTATARRRADPELAVAVAEGRRGNGLGTRLMNELADAARACGFTRLSLSVDVDNPALRLYERHGYRELARDEGGVRMLLDL